VDIAAYRRIESFTPLPLRQALRSDSGSAAVSDPDGPIALLWLDIVDSTRIADSFVSGGVKGVEQLAGLLTRHFDILIRIVIAHGGEPMMFAGDGLLAGWRSGAGGPNEAVLRACACGAAILDTPGLSLPSGAPLRLHAILALGPCQNIEIGVGSERLCTATGAGLADLRATARNRAPGKLLISAAAHDALGDAATVLPAGQDATVTLVRLRNAPQPAPLAILPLPDEVVERLKANVPLPIANRLDSGNFEWSAELRRVTAVFVALPDLEPGEPDIVSRLESVIATVSPSIRQHDGFLQQLQVADSGIKLLILFGVPPVAHADDPLRGVRLAIDLQAQLRGLGYRTGFGVATGLSFSGLIGNDIFRAWTGLGMPLNLASRLAGLPGGDINCDETTMRGAGGSVDFASLGTSEVRGVGAVVALWSPRRYDLPEAKVSMEALLTAQQTSTLDLTRGGLQRLALVEADSGMGKSFLLAEFERQVAAEGVNVLAGKADRIENAVPYLGWRGVLARLLVLASGASEAAQRDAALAALGPGLRPHAALLNAMLPLGLPETKETEFLTPPQRASARVAFLLDLLRREAAKRPIVVTIDDAQWLDEASWSLVQAAAMEIPRLFFVLALHPPEDERQVKTMTAAGAQRLQLFELTEDEQDRLVMARLGAGHMDSELSALLRERTQGHPFFSLELAHALHDEGVIEVVDQTCRIASNIEAAQLSLPDTVHGAVTRRIDRLDPESQLTLKVASVTGLRFPTPLILDVHPTARTAPETIRRHLALHVSVDLLQAEAVEEMEGHAFRHGMLRDVAYSLMLYSQRRLLHLEIASWYERIWSSDLSRFFALLAHHLEAADQPERAAHYLRLEAERVFGLGLPGQSVEIGQRAARILGVDIPTDSGALQRALGVEFERIATLLDGRGPEELTDLPPLVDARAGQLIHLLLVIAPFAHQAGKVEAFALFGCIGLRLTLEYGVGALGADVFAMYSVVFGALTGDRDTAAAWSRLSLAILGDRRDAGFARCAFIHAWFHNHWTAPLAQGIALADEGAEAGFADNELIYGCFNLSASVVLKVAASKSLPEVMEAARTGRARNDGRVANAFYHFVIELQFAKALSGLTDGLLVLGDAEYTGDRDPVSILKTNLTNQIGYYLVAQTKLHAHAGDWSGALQWGEKAQKMLPFFGGQTAEFELTQYRGLAALASAVFDAPEGREARVEQGRACTERLRNWASRNPDLFGHKADLLDGLLQAALGAADVSALLLLRAADRGERGGFLQDAALAHEHLARLRLASGDQAGAALAGIASRRLFRVWGAEAKVALLERLFGRDAEL
jgi:predicted ATPase/class 3 adenylate cyclase